MKILVCGAHGFIGSAVCDRLREAGHDVIKGVRRPCGNDEVPMDYACADGDRAWEGWLRGIDVVVNAVGILVESSDQRFDRVHAQGPIALFRACANAGVRRVIQISALGAAEGNTGYFVTKRRADEFLMSQDIEWQVVRPSLVYGDRGDSSRFFRLLASLPLTVVPADGHQMVQPIHIEDLTQIIGQLVDSDTPPRQCVDVVGRAAVEYRHMLQVYRHSMGLPPAPTISVPGVLMDLCARLLDSVPGSILTRETWCMLKAGNVGDCSTSRRLLGRDPVPLEQFISRAESVNARLQSLAEWRPALLRGALAFVWLATGVVSLCAYPIGSSLDLLAKAGVPVTLQLPALTSAVALDLGFGAATLWRPSRVLWLLQAFVVLLYSTIIVVTLPDFLIHPFGPVIKNIPVMAILFVLFSEETGS